MITTKKLLFSLMALLTIGVSVQAESGTCGTNLTWVYDNGTLTISGTGEMDSYEYLGALDAPWYNSLKSSITTVVVEEGVTSIGARAFKYLENMTSVSLPSTVTSIGSYAFLGSTKLATITIPANVTTLGKGAFQGASGLESITLPNGLLYINELVFNGCNNLSSITIPSTVTTIGANAFQSCTSLTTVNIPASVTNIGGAVFMYCDHLQAINVSADNPSYSSINGVFYDKAKTRLMQYPAASTATSCVIPEGVTTVNAYAFYNSVNLTSISIPSTLTTLGTAAFSGCKNWEGSVVLPNAMTSIPNDAFRGCEKLTSISLPSSLTTLGTSVFQDCKAWQGAITIPSGVTNIVWNAFRGCSSLTAVTLGDNVTSIGDYAFYGCSQLTSINIPAGVTSIGGQAFANCPCLTGLTISASNENYLTEDGVLFNKTKTTLYIYPAGKTATGYTVPETVTTISSGGFSGLSHLKDLTLPEGLTTFGSRVFENATSLETVNIPVGITYLSERTFAGCTNLRHLTLPEGFTQISYYVFDGSGLTSIDLPSTLERVDKYGFLGASKLETIDFSGTKVNAISGCVFDGCSSLRSIKFSPKTTFISYDSFRGCDNLQCFDLTVVEKKDWITEVNYTSGKMFGNVPASALIYLPIANATNVTGTNIVNSADGENFTCERYEVADGKGITIPYAFTATAIDNTRLLMQGTDAYTLCLPYALTSDANIQFFELGSASEGTLTFTEVDATEPLKPYLAVAITAESEGSKLLASTASDVAVSATTAFDGGATVIGNYTLEGTLQPVSNASAAAMQAYILQEGNRWGKVTESNAMANIPAQRAFITSTVPSPAMETILSGTTGVRQLRTIGHDGTETYYDLNGRRIGSGQAKKGIVIVNGKKVIF